MDRGLLKSLVINFTDKIILKKSLINSLKYGIIITEREREVNKMLELICAIPDSIGWTMVGFTEALCIIAAFRLGKIFFVMWKDRHEDF